MDKSGILGSTKGRYGQIRAIKGKYSETCDEGTPQKVSLHNRCPLVTGTFQC